MRNRFNENPTTANFVLRVSSLIGRALRLDGCRHPNKMQQLGEQLHEQRAQNAASE
jgi:hypothetical protein